MNEWGIIMVKGLLKMQEKGCQKCPNFMMSFLNGFLLVLEQSVLSCVTCQI